MDAEHQAPWICPDCGTPNDHTNCDRCFRPRPFDVPVGNEPGSYFNTIYGRIGAYGLPTYIAIIVLIVIIGSIATSVVAPLMPGSGYRSLPPYRPMH